MLYGLLFLYNTLVFQNQTNLAVMKKTVAKILFCAMFVSTILLQGCKKQNATLNLPQLADYYPMQSGKVLIYREDSTHLDVTAMVLLVNSYLIKDSIGTVFNDNTGRPSYPIYRFITDTLSSAPWQALYTYYVTATTNNVEVVDDNNLRFIKLVEPLTDSFTWNGNSHIDTKSATSPYQYMDGWNYIYRSVNMPFTVLEGNIDSTVTILQDDNTSPPGPFDATNYQQRIYSLEVYGKGIGLIYKNFLYWTWQPQPPPAQYQTDSYGIVLNLISVQ